MLYNPIELNFSKTVTQTRHQRSNEGSSSGVFNF